VSSCVLVFDEDLLLGALTGLLAGLIPAHCATRITPAQALRSA
jgi:ABC-type lipoprotein release transport system permease subunit